MQGQRRTFLAVSGTVTGEDTLEYRFRLPQVTSFGKASTEDFGIYVVSYRLVQTAVAPIAAASVCVLLPEETVVNKIVSSLPVRKANAPGSPYILGMKDGRHCVTLTDSTVQQGDVLALVFQAKAAAKSPWLILGLVLCAAAYLVAFRDLLKSPETVGSIPGKNIHPSSHKEQGQ